MKKIYLLIALSFLSLNLMAAEKRILMMVSEGFYAPEYYVPYKAFKNAGYHVTTATKYKRATNPDERQLSTYAAVIPDLTFDQINVNDYDAIVFAGGNGAWEDFFPNPDVHQALAAFIKNDKIVALLCSSTGLLALANNLDGMGEPLAKGMNVTGYKRVRGLLEKIGEVKYSPGIDGLPHVVVDGKLITGRDPISAMAFAQVVVRELGK